MNLDMKLDPNAGKIGAWFIIPSNLSSGDSFFDETLNKHIIIEEEELLRYAGSKRVIISSTTNNRYKWWDKKTGIFVECIDFLGEFPIIAKAVKTNLWEEEELNSISP